MPTKFHQNPSSGSGEEVEKAKMIYGLKTDERRSTTIAHSSLRLRLAKNSDFLKKFKSEILKRIMYNCKLEPSFLSPTTAQFAI